MIKQFGVLFFILALPFLSLSQEYEQVIFLGHNQSLTTEIHEIDDKGNAYVSMEHTYRPWSSFLFPNGEDDGPEILAKLSPTGKLLWSKPLVATIYRIKTDRNENAYVSGVGKITLDNGNILPYGSFVIKLDKNGKSIWGVVAEYSNTSQTSGPICIGKDGIYWTSPFYGTVMMQNHTLKAFSTSAPDFFVAKISNEGLITSLYQDQSIAIPTEMLEAENENVAVWVNRGGMKNVKLIIDDNCKVLSTNTLPIYGTFIDPNITKTSDGYEILASTMGQNQQGAWFNKGFYDFRFDENMDLIDSVKIFEAYRPLEPDKGGKFILDAIGSKETGYFMEHLPKPYLSASRDQLDWLHLDKNFNITEIANENSYDKVSGDDFRRYYVKMVGDTLHMKIRRYTLYRGKTFKLNNQTYTSPSIGDYSWFWAKYVYKDPDACKKIKVQVLKQGIEGSQNVSIVFKLPDDCPASEDLIIPISLEDPTKNFNDLVLPTEIKIEKGVSSVELIIPVIDDNLMENSETYNLLFSINTNSAGYVLYNSNVKFVVDDDDNEEMLDVSFPSQVEEGKAGLIVLKIPNGKVSPVDIPFTLSLNNDLYSAERDLDFILPVLIIPAFTNSIQLNINALDDDLLEGDEYINGIIKVDSTVFRNLKIRTENVNIKIIDSDNTYENRVFYISPFIDTLQEGSIQSYDLNLKYPLKLQRPISISSTPLRILPLYVTQSASIMKYSSASTEFIVSHLENLYTGTEKSVTFNWNASDENTGLYRFSWKNGFSDFMEIHLLDNDFNSLGAPNTFSPNGDGVNDTWIIEAIRGLKCKVLIINRYGSIVFSSTGYSIPWDGKFGGIDVPQGAYYYKISVNNKTFAGNINIVR